MAYPNTATKRKRYNRPLSMIDAIAYEKVARTTDQPGLRAITIPMPAALKVKPEGSFRLYTEPDVIESPVSNIICSGSVLLVTEGSDTGSARMIGVLRHDASPSDVGVVICEGSFLLQADPTLSQDASTLNGSPAYYDVDDGLIYSAAGDSSDTRLEVGYFDGQISELEVANQKISGYHYVSVFLDPALMRAANSAVSLPSDSSGLTNTTTPYVRGDITAIGGLDQVLTISASSPDPRFKAGDLTLSVSVEGSTVYTGKFTNQLNVTFTAGSGKAVVFTVTDPDGNSGNATYTVTTHATNAPLSWARS